MHPVDAAADQDAGLVHPDAPTTGDGPIDDVIDAGTGDATRESGADAGACTLTCGPRQLCVVTNGTAACMCTMDPICRAVGQACADPSNLANCAQDSQGCFYESASSPCTNGACSAGACCTNACTNGATQCVTSATLQTCSLGTNGCTAWGAAVACSPGLVCERYGTAACADPNWAAWPMPNTPPDVTNGAPHQEAYADNGDGTVTDSVTGLMWQQTVASTNYPWGSATTAGTAQNYCVSLQLAGHSDWRLPTIIETLSVIDPSLWTTSQPMMNATYFPLSSISIPSFVTATPVAGAGATTSPGWGVFFEATGDPLTFSTAAGVARCVR